MSDDAQMGLRNAHVTSLEQLFKWAERLERRQGVIEEIADGIDTRVEQNTERLRAEAARLERAEAALRDAVRAAVLAHEAEQAAAASGEFPVIRAAPVVNGNRPRRERPAWFKGVIPGGMAAVLPLVLAWLLAHPVRRAAKLALASAVTGTAVSGGALMLSPGLPVAAGHVHHCRDRDAVAVLMADERRGCRDRDGASMARRGKPHVFRTEPRPPLRRGQHRDREARRHQRAAGTQRQRVERVPGQARVRAHQPRGRGPRGQVPQLGKPGIQGGQPGHEKVKAATAQRRGADLRRRLRALKRDRPQLARQCCALRVSWHRIARVGQLRQGPGDHVLIEQPRVALHPPAPGLHAPVAGELPGALPVVLSLA